MTREQVEAHQRKHGFLPPAQESGAPIKTISRASSCGVRAMNRSEAEFSLILEAMRQKGELSGWLYEACRLRLADRTTYTPDFLTWRNMGAGAAVCIRFIEVKGFRRDDAMVKFKVAREAFPWAVFEMWSKIDGQWTRLY